MITVEEACKDDESNPSLVNINNSISETMSSSEDTTSPVLPSASPPLPPVSHSSSSKEIELKPHNMTTNVSQPTTSSAESSEEKESNTSSFPCTTCGKIFIRSHNLQSHMLTHKGEKKHVCELCGMTFVRKHDLQR